MAPGTAQRISRPATSDEISKIAYSILQKASAHGRLPTPIDDLLSAAKIADMSDSHGFLDRFLSSVDEKAGDFLRSALQKIRGLADLREKAIYASPAKPARVLFAKSHELGHELIPWHNPFPAASSKFYKDDDKSLSPYAEELFDQEANFFAAEVMFQGQSFTKKSLDYRPSMDAVFLLADQHGASRQATLRRFVETHDEEVAALTYFPNLYILDKHQRPMLNKPRLFMSRKFTSKFGALTVPTLLPSDHEWATCCNSTNETAEGEVSLQNGSNRARFRYWAWWNTYTLLILLRHEPLITRIRNSIV